MINAPVPVLPVMSTKGWRFPIAKNTVEDVYSGMTVCKVESGTSAIALALGLSGIDSLSEVLVPAYNCKSMREPVWVHGAQDVLYAVHADLSIDIADVESKLTARSKAILVPHFFGFPQPMRDIKRLCAENDLTLIEDCAHVFYRMPGGDSIGTNGDYIVGSATKFFPVTDGGFLASSSHDLSVIRDRGNSSIKRDLKALVNGLEISFKHGRLPVLRFVFSPFIRMVSRLREQADEVSGATVEQAARQLDHIDRENYGRPMTRTARVIVGFCSPENAVDRRRLNYIRLCQVVAGLSRCEALFPEIPSATIPYMVPVIISDPEETFPVLKRSGFPMYRWENCGRSDCEISNRYTRELIHLPCHEQLTSDELERMIELLQRHLA